jgi:murein DD-endopeptidase MepM/ murein hydrolase activator NlpD
MLAGVRKHRLHLTLWIFIAALLAVNLYLLGVNYVFFNAVSNENSIAEGPETTIEAEAVKEDDVPKNLDAPKALSAPKISENRIFSIELKKGDTINKVFVSAGMDTDVVYGITESLKGILNLNELKPGTHIRLEARESVGVIPHKITFFLDNAKIETMLNAKNNFKSKKITLPNEWKLKFASGKITGSLFNSARRSGIDPAVIVQMINLFSYDVDFQRDVQIGDKFKVLYEYQSDYRNERVARNPKIIYAGLNLDGKWKDLYRYEKTEESLEYFDSKGSSIKKALLRTPINGARITSRFGLRHHPIHGYSKMHQGLDYGAPKGTPVFAAGNGSVELVKAQSAGYGNHVKIKHDNTYSTLYAHMSKFARNIRNGAKIKQGQIIGYVGDTGTATGPHLHYEVIEKGRKINPAKFKAFPLSPLKGKELAKFKENIFKVDHMVADLGGDKFIDVAYNKKN